MTGSRVSTWFSNQQESSVEQRVSMIQQGNEAMRSDLIVDSQPFVRGIVGRMLQKNGVEQHDEYSIALGAFSDAIDGFDPQAGVPFFKYAGPVINRKLIDWLRSQKRHTSNTLPFASIERADGSSFVSSIEDEKSSRFDQEIEIEEELLLLRDRLTGFGLSFSELTKHFPRHRDSRLTCLRTAQTLVSSETLYRSFEIKKQLPMSELSHITSIPLKTVQRNRGSIILLALLLTSGLEVIKYNLMMFSRED